MTIYSRLVDITLVRKFPSSTDLSVVGIFGCGEITLQAVVAQYAMSENDNVDESGEGTDSLNRRNFVKALGVAGGATVFGAASIGHAAARGNGRATDVNRDDLMSQEQVSTDVQSVLSTRYGAQLKQRLVDEGVVPNEADAIGVDSSIDAHTAAQQLQKTASHGKHVSVEQLQRLNRLNPVTVLLPFSSEDSNQAGLLTILVVDNQEDPNLPDRVPLTMFGLSSADSSASSSSAGRAVSAANAESNAMAEVQEFTWSEEEDGVTQSNQEMVSTTDINPSNGQVSTSGVLSCTACLGLAGYICANPGIIGAVLQCGRYCVRAIAASIFAAAACQAACTALFVAISELGCGVTGAALCASTPLC